MLELHAKAIMVASCRTCGAHRGECCKKTNGALMLDRTHSQRLRSARVALTLLQTRKALEDAFGSLELTRDESTENKGECP